MKTILTIAVLLTATPAVAAQYDLKSKPWPATCVGTLSIEDGHIALANTNTDEPWCSASIVDECTDGCEPSDKRKKYPGELGYSARFRVLKGCPSQDRPCRIEGMIKGISHDVW